MQSYSQEISPYLFAAAEGTIVGSLLHSDYHSIWEDLFQNKMMRFTRDQITARWEGDQSSDMAGTPGLWENLVAFFQATNTRSADASAAAIRIELNSALNQLINTDVAYTNTFVKKISEFISAPEVRDWGEKEARSKGAENDSVEAAVGMMGIAIWRFRLRADLHKIMLASQNEKQDYMLSQNLGTIADLVKGPRIVQELYPVLSWQAKMAAHDLLDLEKGDQPLQLLSAKARNRILLQLEGYGGFQIQAHQTATEILSSYLGRTGAWIRPVTFSQKPHSEAQPYDPDALAAAQNSVPYYGRFKFDAGRELAERELLEWITPSDSTSEFTRVLEKSFLDSLAPGATSPSKMILYLDWYIGGMAAWYQVRDRDTSGSLMREEPTPDARIAFGNALKVDTHFRIEDVIACSQLPKDGSIDKLVHHTLDFRKDDIVVYKRKHTVGLANIGGFEPKDCQFQMLDTLGGGAQVNRKGLDAVYDSVMNIFQ